MTLYFVCVCMWKLSYPCTRFSWAVFFYDSGENIAKGAGKRGQLLVERTQNLFLCEKMSKQGEWKVDDEDVTVGSLEQWGISSGLSSR